jgi:hypothetical protein
MSLSFIYSCNYFVVYIMNTHSDVIDLTSSKIYKPHRMVPSNPPTVDPLDPDQTWANYSPKDGFHVKFLDEGPRPTPSTTIDLVSDNSGDLPCLIDSSEDSEDLPVAPPPRPSKSTFKKVLKQERHLHHPRGHKHCEKEVLRREYPSKREPDLDLHLSSRDDESDMNDHLENKV